MQRPSVMPGSSGDSDPAVGRPENLYAHRSRQLQMGNRNEVEKAVLEINGSLSVLKKTAYRNVTKQELDALFKKLQRGD